MTSMDVDLNVVKPPVCKILSQSQAENKYDEGLKNETDTAGVVKAEENLDIVMVDCEDETAKQEENAKKEEGLGEKELSKAKPQDEALNLNEEATTTKKKDEDKTDSETNTENKTADEAANGKELDEAAKRINVIFQEEKKDLKSCLTSKKKPTAKPVVPKKPQVVARQKSTDEPRDETPVLRRHFYVTTKEVTFKDGCEVRMFSRDESDVDVYDETRDIDEEAINECTSEGSLKVMLKTLEHKIDQLLSSNPKLTKEIEQQFRRLTTLCDLILETRKRIKAASKVQEELPSQPAGLARSNSSDDDEKEKKACKPKRNSLNSDPLPSEAKTLQDIIANYVQPRNCDLCVLFNFHKRDPKPEIFNDQKFIREVVHILSQINGLRINIWYMSKDKGLLTTGFISSGAEQQDSINFAPVEGTFFNNLVDAKWTENALRFLWCVNQDSYVDIFAKERENEAMKSYFDSLLIQVKDFAWRISPNIIEQLKSPKCDEIDKLEKIFDVGYMSKYFATEKALHKNRELYNIARFSINEEKEFESYKTDRRNGFSSEVRQIEEYLYHKYSFTVDNITFRYNNKSFHSPNQKSVFEFLIFDNGWNRKETYIWGQLFTNKEIGAELLKVKHDAKFFIKQFNEVQYSYKLLFFDESWLRQGSKYTTLFSNHQMKVKHAEVNAMPSEIDHVLQAFTHFCYDHSSQNRMVLALNAFPETYRSQDAYGYSTSGPLNIQIYECVMFSPKLEYGASDLGTRGMQDFLKAHKCGNLCKHILKKDKELGF